MNLIRIDDTVVNLDNVFEATWQDDADAKGWAFHGLVIACAGTARDDTLLLHAGDTPAARAAWEYITNNLVWDSEAEVTGQSDEDDIVKIIGELASIEEFTTRHYEVMAELQLDCGAEYVRVTVFPKRWHEFTARYGHPLTGQTLVITGRWDVLNAERVFIAERLTAQWTKERAYDALQNTDESRLYQRRIAELEAENDRLLNETSELSVAVSELEAENARLEDRLLQAENTRDDARDEVRLYQRRIAELAAENGQLRGRIADLHDEANTRRASMDTLWYAIEIAHDYLIQAKRTDIPLERAATVTDAQEELFDVMVNAPEVSQGNHHEWYVAQSDNGKYIHLKQPEGDETRCGKRIWSRAQPQHAAVRCPDCRMDVKVGKP